MPDFVNLHNHSQFSLLDGLATAKDYATRAKELGQWAIACTDHGSVDGLLRFQKECEKAGVEPILGCEIYVVPDAKIKQKDEKRGHMTILIRNKVGYRALLRLMTRAHLEGFYSRPRIGFDWIMSLSDDEIAGWVVGSACLGSFLKLPGGDALFDWMAERTDVFLEVMPWPGQEQIEWNQWIWMFSGSLFQDRQIPVVATNDCHYVNEDDWEAQEVLLAVQRKAKWEDKDRFRFEHRGLHLRSYREMVQAFEDHGSLTRTQYLGALVETTRIAEMCKGFRIPKGKISLPMTRYERNGNGMTANEIFRQFCQQGSKRLFPNRMPTEYVVRLSEELEVIEGKDFSRYFLIVVELVEWCRDKGIAVGPGRGSVGGALIAYLCGITQVDPLKYGLIFSRFISEDRNDLPDIDLDFAHDKCDLVRQHLIDEYGIDHIAGISTFGTMAGKAAIRDVARVYDLPQGKDTDVDRFAKFIKAGEHDTEIVRTAADSEGGQWFREKYPKVIEIACRLEGKVRSFGQHPAGIIVSREPLTDGSRCVVMERDKTRIVNWDMGDSEYVGLMKLDILKLSTLTLLDEAKKLIERNHGDLLLYHPESDSWFVGKEADLGDGLTVEIGPFDYPLIPLDDPQVYEMLSKGDTVGVFQMSGYACTKLCKDAGLAEFEDMIAINALARPGPMESGMSDEYVQRKKGRQWERRHEVYERIVEKTYGVLVYQEQVMRVFTDIAGLSASLADKIRKVIGKKRKASEFEPYRIQFVDGCAKTGAFSEQEANEFWKGLLEWAHYGFNKSHSVAYSLIGYYCAWLRVHYPAEFICAALTHGREDRKDLVALAARHGLRAMPPKVGMSDPMRWIAKEDRLYAPFKEIKGIGEAEAQKCAVAKPKGTGPKGFFDSGPVGKETKIDKLLREVGAFDRDACTAPVELFEFEFSGEPIARQPGSADKGTIRPIRYRNEEAVNCSRCDLRKEASRVVLSSVGMLNVAVIGEAPGDSEDYEGQGFVGKVGTELWNELGKYGIIRRQVHVMNCCKCLPSITRTPKPEHIAACALWWKDELRGMECRLVLGLGGTVLFALTGREKGIVGLSGTVEWLNDLGLWVVWCVHPSYVLRRGGGREPWERGIAKFAEAFKLMRG
uniref:Putative DNA polymerase n=1 Tax=viral metagenome TaxID=1070528 RepID=A0A6M3INV2_9ZZZZ